MEIIFSFKENNNEYLVIKNNNQYIPCKKINNTFEYEITEEEYNLINYVFNKIKTTDNRIKLSNFKYKEIEYQHLYDKTNNYHIFYNLDGSEIDNNIFSELNMLFNYQSEILYIDNNKKEKKLKRLVNIGKKAILVLVTSTSLISPLSKLTPVKAYDVINYESIVGSASYYEMTDEEKIEKLISALKNNKNLDEDTKEFYLSISNVINDNIDTIDYETIYNRLKNLKLSITEFNKSNNIAGSYNKIDDEITMRNFTSDQFVYDTSHAHEFYHVLQPNDSYRGFIEPVNDILVNEYVGIEKKNDFRSYSCGYNEIKPYIYTLMEIVDPKCISSQNFSGDESKLKTELMSIINDESKYYELIGYYNLLCNNIYIGDTDYSTMLYVYDKLENLLKEYYEKKYNKPMEENFEIMANLHRYCVIDVLRNDYPTIYDIDLDKMYFNTNYKNEHTKSIIHSCDRMEKRYEKVGDLTYNVYTMYDGDNILDINDTCLIGKSKEMKKEINENKFEIFVKTANNLTFDNIINSNIELNYTRGVLTVTYLDGEAIRAYKISSEYIDKIAYKYLNKNNNIDKYENKEKDVNLSIYKDVLSIYTNSEAYNIDLKTGKKVKLNKLMKLVGINKEEVNNQIENDILEYSKEAVDNYISNKNIEYNKINDYIETINEANITNYKNEGIKSAYINENGKLVLIDEFKGVNKNYNVNFVIGTPKQTQIKSHIESNNIIKK